MLRIQRGVTLPGGDGGALDFKMRCPQCFGLDYSIERDPQGQSFDLVLRCKCGARLGGSALFKEYKRQAQDFDQPSRPPPDGPAGAPDRTASTLDPACQSEAVSSVSARRVARRTEERERAHRNAPETSMPAPEPGGSGTSHLWVGWVAHAVLFVAAFPVWFPLSALISGALIFFAGRAQSSQEQWARREERAAAERQLVSDGLDPQERVRLLERIRALEPRSELAELAMGIAAAIMGAGMYVFHGPFVVYYIVQDDEFWR